MKRWLILLGCLLVWTQAAWGHASLLAATPAPGAVLQQAPDRITLTFNEPVGITVLKLFDPQGRAVALGTVGNQDGHIRIPLAAHDAHRGTFLLSWRIISADGHPVGGTLDYSVGAPSQPTALPAEGGGSRDAAIWLTRWLTFLCLFAAAGAALFRSLHPETSQAWARWPIAAGILLLPVDLGLQGLDMLDTPWSGLAAKATWSAAVGSTYALTLILYVLAFGLAAAAVRRPGARAPRGLGVLALILAGAASAASGHAGTAPPQWLSRPAVTLHVMAAIAWIGVLVPLARGLGTRLAGGIPDPATAGSPSTLKPLAAFSTWITPVVALLAASGLILAYLQLDQWSDLWQTRYGQVLIAKLILVALLLCVAAFNRWRLTRPTLAGERLATRRLKTAIRVELVFALLILATVSLWRLTPPPRSLDAGRAMISAVTLADSRVRAQVNPGAGTWRIRLSTPTAGAFPAQGVTLLLSNPTAGIEPLRRTARQVSPGLWEASVPALPMAGQWRIAVEILIDDFDQIVLQPPGENPGAEPAQPPMAGMPGMDHDASMPGMH